MLNKKYNWFKSSAENSEEFQLTRGLPEEGSVVSSAIADVIEDRATDQSGHTIRDYQIEQGLLDGDFTGTTWSKPLYTPHQWLLQGPLA